MSELIAVDNSGRMVLPKGVRKKLGLVGGGVLNLEIKRDLIILRPTRILKDPAEAIASMNLPVAPWEEVEKEIGEGSVMA